MFILNCENFEVEVSSLFWKDALQNKLQYFMKINLMDLIDKSQKF